MGWRRISPCIHRSGIAGSVSYTHLDLSKASKDIQEKKDEIAKLKEKSEGSAIVAPVAGTISNLAYVAGETTKPEEAAAVIQVDGKGYTVSFSVTNGQSKKVQVCLLYTSRCV